jgi:hypothetical protein
MSTTILLKRGTGVPTGLKYGEIALDVDEKLIYAAKANGEVVEMSGGDIDWNQIINLPPELGGDNLIDLAALEKQVGTNTADIAKLKADVTQLWVELQNAEMLATAAYNKANDNAVNIQANADAIADINAEIGAIESGLIFGGTYSPISGQITNVDAYAVSRGFSEGMTLQPTTSAEQQGIYFIVTEAGTGITNEPVKPGDWIIANSLAWTLVEYGYSTITIDMVAGLEAELTGLKEADSDLDARVTALETEIDAGTYSAAPPFFKG